jgi:GNAT superfamily N-acetyltransferase
MLDLQMRPFQAGDEVPWRALNEDWIVKYFAIEEPERLILRDPVGQILDQGGYIFMALVDGRPIGCCALLAHGEGTFEVAKMTVMEAYRGQGAGKKMLQYVIAQATALGGARLYLETSTKLANAIHLYESLGFRHLPPERRVPSPYARANVFMELML